MKPTTKKWLGGFICGVLATMAALSVYDLIRYVSWANDYIDNHPPQELIEPTVQAPKQTMITAEVTAYTSSPDETDDTPFITASGKTTRKGIVACPTRYSFGTKVVIAGEEYVCEDRMAERYRNINRFDIWVSSKAEAFAHGIKKLSVEIIKI